MKNNIFSFIGIFIIGICLGLIFTQIQYKKIPITNYILAHLGSQKKQEELNILFLLYTAQGIDGALEDAEYWEMRSKR
jgi:hypothetical protein